MSFSPNPKGLQPLDERSLAERRVRDAFLSSGTDLSSSQSPSAGTLTANPSSDTATPSASPFASKGVTSTNNFLLSATNAIVKHSRGIDESMDRPVSSHLKYTPRAGTISVHEDSSSLDGGDDEYNTDDDDDDSDDEDGSKDGAPGGGGGTDRIAAANTLTLKIVDDVEDITKHLSSSKSALRGENCTYNLKEKSLWLFSPENKYRRNTFLMIDHRYFERTILFIIFLNCITLVLDTPVVKDLPGARTVVLVGEILFQILFTLEMIVKVFALGFVLHSHSYLRSGWNQVDFLIVMLGFVQFFVGAKFSAIRLVRVLRPLKAVSKVPELAALVDALLSSAPRMRDALLLLFFLLLIYAILGLQAFAGMLHYRCYVYLNDTAQVYNNVTNLTDTVYFPTLHPELLPGDDSLCGPGGHHCSQGSVCERHDELFFTDYVNFDNLATSMLVVFKIVSMDNWPVNTRSLQQASGFWAFIFPFIVVLFGSFFCVNLILAILSSEYQQASEGKIGGGGGDEAQVDVATELLAEAQEEQAAEVAAEEEEERIEEEYANQKILADSGLFLPEEETDVLHNESSAGGDDRSSFSKSDKGPSSATTPQSAAAAGFGGGNLYAAHNNSNVSAITSNGLLTVDNSNMYPTSSGGDTRRDSRRLSASSMVSSGGSPAGPGGKKRKKRSWLVKLRMVLLTIVASNAFNNFMLVITAINVLVLALDHHNIPERMDFILNWINFSCSLIFLAECALKLGGLGWTYFADGFNRFDFILVLISIPEMALSGSGEGSSFSALRAFRLMRVFRVVKASETIRKLLLTVFIAASSTGYLFLLLCLFLLVAGLVGVNLFSTAYPEGVRPNFNDLAESLLTSFIIITGENWVDTTMVAMHGSHWTAVFYFLVLYCLGNYIVLNLFVAILIGSFANAELSGGDDEDKNGIEITKNKSAVLALSALTTSKSNASSNIGAAEAAVLAVENGQEVKRKKESSTPSSIQQSPQSPTIDVMSNSKEFAPGPELPKGINSADSIDAASLSPSMSQQQQRGGARDTISSSPSTSLRRQESLAEANFERQNTNSSTVSGSSVLSMSPISKKKITLKTVLAGLVGTTRPRKASPSPDSASFGGGELLQKTESMTVENQQQLDVTESPTFENPEPANEQGDVLSPPLKRQASDLKQSSSEVVVIGSSDHDEEEDISLYLFGNSFFFFSAENPVRRVCAKIVTHPYFELGVILLIAFSCIMLGFDNPQSRKDDQIIRALYISDVLLAVLFSLEALLQAISWGMVMGEGSYLSSSWNRLDFVVVLASIVGFFIPVAQMLRSLRVFRLAARSNSLRAVITALFKALPTIGNVVMLLLFGFVVFGILGVSLFKGTFVTCTDESVLYRVNCTGWYYTITDFETLVGDRIINSHEVTVADRAWQHSYFNFNHLGNSLLTLFVLALSDGWSTILYQAMDSQSYDVAMRINSRPHAAFFVLIFVVLGSFFMVNLFIGSLIDNFSKERDKKEGRIDEEGMPLLSDNQAQWLRAWKIAKTSSLQKRSPAPKNAIRELCCRIFYEDEGRTTPDNRFEVLVTVLIVLNVLFMCIQTDGQPDEVTEMIWIVNLIFAILYTIEALIKNIAMMPTGYFSDGWNRFDFILVPVAYISLFVGGPGTNAVRTLRVLRVLRLIKRAEGLQRLFNSLLYAIPQLLNTTLLLMLTLFIFGVVGTALFGEVMIAPEYAESSLDEFFNFKNAGYSMVLLFQIATTEGWWDVMKSVMIDETNSPCHYDEGNCGTVAAIPFFILFMLAATCVCVNLFIFVIVDNYLEVQQLADEKSQTIFSTLETFKMEWMLIDRDATETMRWESLIIILRKMPKELGIKDSKRNMGDLGMMKKLRQMDIPVDAEGNVQYQYCVRGLTKDLFGVHDEVMPGHIQESELENCFKVHHALACRKIAKIIRAKTKERELKKRVADKLREKLMRRRELGASTASVANAADNGSAGGRSGGGGEKMTNTPDQEASLLPHQYASHSSPSEDQQKAQKTVASAALGIAPSVLGHERLSRGNSSEGLDDNPNAVPLAE